MEIQETQLHLQVQDRWAMDLIVEVVITLSLLQETMPEITEWEQPQQRQNLLQIVSHQGVLRTIRLILQDRIEIQIVVILPRTMVRESIRRVMGTIQEILTIVVTEITRQERIKHSKVRLPTAQVIQEAQVQERIIATTEVPIQATVRIIREVHITTEVQGLLQIEAVVVVAEVVVAIEAVVVGLPAALQEEGKTYNNR